MYVAPVTCVCVCVCVCYSNMSYLLPAFLLSDFLQLCPALLKDLRQPSHLRLVSCCMRGSELAVARLQLRDTCVFHGGDSCQQLLL